MSETITEPRRRLPPWFRRPLGGGPEFAKLSSLVSGLGRSMHSMGSTLTSAPRPSGGGISFGGGGGSSGFGGGGGSGGGFGGGGGGTW